MNAERFTANTMAMNRPHRTAAGRPWRYPTRVESDKSRKERPSISVVIPAFNEARYIADTLESVSRASDLYRGSVEVIVVDNNSTDSTSEIAREMGADVVFERKNQIARARNRGAKAASGDHLIFLDADTTIEGNIFAKVDSNLSSGRIIGGGAWAAPDVGWFGRSVYKYAINYTLALKNLTVGPFLYCEPRSFHKVGGFDEELYAAEEFSLANRLKAEGRKLRKGWKIIKYHRQHRVVTSGRKFDRFGGLEMAVQNAHLIWRPNRKLRQKSQCSFWYEVRSGQGGFIHPER